VPFDPDDLDPEDPFELDEGNRPKLCRHFPYTEADLLDIYYADPMYYPTGEGEETTGGRRRAQWLMVGQPPAEPPLVVPLAAPNSGLPNKARPVSIYPATGQLKDDYLNDTGQMQRSTRER
jgi:hypothetical protein